MCSFSMERATVLRWIGEIDIAKEDEILKIFQVAEENDKHRRTKMSVASWYAGVDVVETERCLFSDFILDASIVRRILLFLSPADLGSFARTCSGFRVFVQDDKLWEGLCHRDWDASKKLSPDARAAGITWRGTYQYLATGEKPMEMAPQKGKVQKKSFPFAENRNNNNENNENNDDNDDDDDLEKRLLGLIERLEREQGREHFPVAMSTLTLFVTRYPRVRVTAPKLAALGATGVEVLKACGFREDDHGWLSVPFALRDHGKRAREVMELLCQEAQRKKKGGGGTSGGAVATSPSSTSVASSMSAVLLLNAPKGSHVKPNTCSVAVGVYDSIGRRSEMEDEMACDRDVFAVFDGHGGSNAARLCAALVSKLLHEAREKTRDHWKTLASQVFASMHQQVEDLQLSSGCTALVVHLTPTSLRLAHAGDSRAVLARRGGVAVRLTEDHKPERPDEQARIVASGGRVVRTFFSRVYRINGELAISRAIGDAAYERWGLSHEPECSVIERSDEDEVLVLACDGVWDVLSDDEVAVVACAAHNVGEAAQQIVDLSYRRGSEDNLSVCCIDLRSHYNEFL